MSSTSTARLSPWLWASLSHAVSHAPVAALATAAAVVALAWAALHLVFWLLPQHASPPPRPVGPTTRVPVRVPRDVVAMRLGSLRVTTTRFSSLFRLPGWLRPAAQVFYLAGALATLLFAVYLAGNVLWMLGRRLGGELGPLAPADLGLDVAGPADDEYDDDNTEAAPDTSAYAPLVSIPGLNLPASLLRPYLVALAGALAVHELGHALAAAAWGIPVHSVSFSLHLVFPGASVNLRVADLAAAPARARAAVAAAGIWHNLLGALLCTLLVARPTLWLRAAGYHVPATYPSGLVVLDVSPTSSLAGALPPFSRLVAINGARVTSLADLHTADRVIPPIRQCRIPDPVPLVYAPWDSVPGAVPAWADAPAPVAPCCLVNATHPVHESGDVCFVHVASAGTACVSPAAIAARKRQCADDADCAVGFCMSTYAANPRVMLADLAFRPAGSEEIDRVLWMGDLRDLARDVHVGRVVPRREGEGDGASWWRPRPVWVPYFVVSVLEFAAQISLSLALLNVLPFAALDGRHFFAAVAEVIVFCASPWCWWAETPPQQPPEPEPTRREEDEAVVVFQPRPPAPPPPPPPRQPLRFRRPW
ncbi:hypothetical protein H9P43_007545 [Blastocladiella emersonii ATCC 22665]|nr:hypothetical protein H9P43_007545 [Blastocladiella emersonii ATCC 22665]